MCLGIPGKIIDVWQEPNGAPMAHVDFAGDIRRICLAYLPYLAVGDYLVAHMGYALTKIDEESAEHTMNLMREYGVLAPQTELAPSTEPESAA
ncbi:MAG: HypC/HybG/HupF family hydrogenase formation chaperone [Actinobacteria bacterium]|nr:HypC/HybG/HupF family hydrogenase formation chaperone [Actinomycetota bacterium]